MTTSAPSPRCSSRSSTTCAPAHRVRPLPGDVEERLARRLTGPPRSLPNNPRGYPTTCRRPGREARRRPRWHRRRRCRARDVRLRPASRGRPGRSRGHRRGARRLRGRPARRRRRRSPCVRLHRRGATSSEVVVAHVVEGLHDPRTRQERLHGLAGGRARVGQVVAHSVDLPPVVHRVDHELAATARRPGSVRYFPRGSARITTSALSGGVDGRGRVRAGREHLDGEGDLLRVAGARHHHVVAGGDGEPGQHGADLAGAEDADVMRGLGSRWSRTAARGPGGSPWCRTARPPAVAPTRGCCPCCR